VRLMSKSWFATSADFGLLHQEIPLRIKRTIDVLGALIGILLLGWLMLLILILVKLQDGGSAIYKQKRVGVNDRSFSLYKFRTMVIDAEKDGAQWTVKGDSRITRLGKYLRAARLDELPQLFNVLRGDMSLIGPRPERPSFVAQLEEKIPFYSYRHAVKPGITGWAQVMYPYGASEEDAERKLEYDLYYIRHFTLMLDMFIVLRTLRVVFFGKGR
jgi:exopolysaccharide biosynthesis polyprenyl glycosylphosphotransferase